MFLGVLALLAASLPSLLAGLLAVAGAGGDHEIRITPTEGGFELTLHHVGQSPHRHTALERLILGDADEDEPDHHLCMTLTDRCSEMSEDESSPVVVDRPVAVVLPLPRETADLRPFAPGATVSRRGPPPLWRGVVMTI